MRGRAVVLLQPDHPGALEVALEAQDVAHLGPAPAIDRLVVVAHAADVAVLGGEQAQPQVLGDIGVLVLIDQDVFEPLLVVGEHVRVVLEDLHHMQQQVAEIDRVEGLQARLVGGVELAAAAVGEAAFVAGHLPGPLGAVLPAVDHRGEHPCRPALLVNVPGAEQLLDQPDLVVGVEDGEGRFQPRQLGVAAQDPDADGVEGAEPRHALDGTADQFADPLLHLARRLVGEGDGEDLAGPGALVVDQMRQPGGQHPGLAGARTRQHQHRAVERLDRLALVRVELRQIGRGRAGALGERPLLRFLESRAFVEFDPVHERQDSRTGAEGKGFVPDMFAKSPVPARDFIRPRLAPPGNRAIVLRDGSNQ